jgi:hypothetical protein
MRALRQAGTRMMMNQAVTTSGTVTTQAAAVGSLSGLVPQAAACFEAVPSNVQVLDRLRRLGEKADALSSIT